jgi:hypothetical protein
MHIFQTQFLYVLFKEIDRDVDENGRATANTDTQIRIVYWQDDSDENGGYYMIYGRRPTSKYAGEYIPYRVLCKDIDRVIRFINTVVSSDNDVSVDLHQFDGLNDDSEDQFNVSWENTAENRNTELAAYDFQSAKKDSDGKFKWHFKPTLKRFLRLLAESEVV